MGMELLVGSPSKSADSYVASHSESLRRAMPTYRTTRRVEFRDTDAAGIMHFSAFFTCMESVEHEFLRHVGLSVMTPEGDGLVSWPRVSASCDFRSGARFEDVLEVELSIGRLGGKSVTYLYLIDIAGRRVAEGRIVAACVRMAHGSPMRGIAIPAGILEKLRPYVTEARGGES